MKRILVTGATGHLGRGIVEHLLKLKPSSEIAVLARDPAKAVDLSAKGVEVRRGDYFDLESLKRAFAGVGKLMFVSTVTFTDGLTQHRNVVAAAKAAGVEHVHYTSIQHREGSNFVISVLVCEGLPLPGTAP
jgi:NAD(P)H dehydrogenase (quinone)